MVDPFLQDLGVFVLYDPLAEFTHERACFGGMVFFEEIDGIADLIDLKVTEGTARIGVHQSFDQAVRELIHKGVFTGIGLFQVFWT